MGNLLCPKKEVSNKIGPAVKEKKSVKINENHEVSLIVDQSIQKADPNSKDLSETATQAKFNQKDAQVRATNSGNHAFTTLHNPSQKLDLESTEPNPILPSNQGKPKDLRSAVPAQESTVQPKQERPPAVKNMQIGQKRAVKSEVSLTIQNPLSLLPKTPSLHLFNLLNESRTNPKSLLEPLAELVGDLDPNLKLLNSRRQGLAEGRPAFIEAQAFLETHPPVCELDLDLGLSLAATAHARYMSEANELTHVGPTVEHSTARKRAEHYGRFEKFGMQGVGEVVFSGVRGELEALLSVVVDDGMPGRPNREMLFDERAVQVGIGICPPPPAPGHGKWFYCVLIAWPSYISDPKTYPADALQAAGLL